MSGAAAAVAEMATAAGAVAVATSTGVGEGGGGGRTRGNDDKEVGECRGSVCGNGSGDRHRIVVKDGSGHGESL